MEPLRLRAAVVDAIVAHARASAPDECCGMLIGLGHRIDEAVAARNIADRPSSRFLIDPRDHLDALRRARRRGLDVVGFYHSHPRSDATPSPVDVAEASYPNLLFLIVGLGSTPPDVRLHHFVEGIFLPMAFVTAG